MKQQSSNNSIINSGKLYTHQSLPLTPVNRGDISFCTFSNCQISAIKLEDSLANNMRAVDSHFMELNILESHSENNYFNSCCFDKLNIDSSFMTNNTFTDCTLNGLASKLSSFAMGNFDKTLLDNSNMSEVSFIGSIWKDCTIKDSKWFFVRLPSCLFINTKFINCELKKVIFRAATFINCSFESCDLTDSVFHNAYLKGSPFIDTDINQAANTNNMKVMEA